MHNITEHDAEEKGEGHYSEECRIDLSVLRHTVSINHILEPLCHRGLLEESRLPETIDIFGA